MKVHYTVKTPSRGGTLEDDGGPQDGAVPDNGEATDGGGVVDSILDEDEEIGGKIGEDACEE